MITTPTAAARDGGVLDQFLGVWSGRGVVMVNQAGKAVATARDIDVALWSSESGYEMTWTNLSQSGAPRIMIRFSALSEPGIVKVTWTDLPQGTDARLQLEDSRLTVFLSGVTPHLKPLARYDYSMSDDGRMTLEYALSHGSKRLESVTTQLDRAKVVM